MFYAHNFRTCEVNGQIWLKLHYDLNKIVQKLNGHL